MKKLSLKRWTEWRVGDSIPGSANIMDKSSEVEERVMHLRNWKEISITGVLPGIFPTIAHRSQWTSLCLWQTNVKGAEKELGSSRLAFERGLGMKGCWQRWGWPGGVEWWVGGGALEQATHSRLSKVTEALSRKLDYTKDDGTLWKGVKQERSLSIKGRKCSWDAFKKSTCRCYRPEAQRRVWP